LGTNALENVEVAGEPFRKGDIVGLLLGSANRDPVKFADPDRFDAARSPNPHVSFGVGAPLARLEMQVAIRVLFGQLSGMRIAEPPRVKDAWHFHGLEALHVAW
jgi:cytochrome P450